MKEEWTLQISCRAITANRSLGMEQMKSLRSLNFGCRLQILRDSTDKELGESILGKEEGETY